MRYSDVNHNYTSLVGENDQMRTPIQLKKKNCQCTHTIDDKHQTCMSVEQSHKYTPMSAQHDRAGMYVNVIKSVHFCEAAIIFVCAF